MEATKAITGDMTINETIREWPETVAPALLIPRTVKDSSLRCFWVGLLTETSPWFESCGALCR